MMINRVINIAFSFLLIAGLLTGMGLNARADEVSVEDSSADELTLEDGETILLDDDDQNSEDDEPNIEFSDITVTEVDGIPEEFAPFLSASEYEVKYINFEDGSGEWYLINNIKGTRVKLSEVDKALDASDSNSNQIYILKNKLRRVKIVLGCIIVVLLGLLSGFIIMWKLEKDKNAKASKENKKPFFKKRDVDVDDYSESGATKFEE